MGGLPGPAYSPLRKDSTPPKRSQAPGDLGFSLCLWFVRGGGSAGLLRSLGQPEPRVAQAMSLHQVLQFREQLFGFLPRFPFYDHRFQAPEELFPLPGLCRAAFRGMFRFLDPGHGFGHVPGRGIHIVRGQERRQWATITMKGEENYLLRTS